MLGLFINIIVWTTIINAVIKGLSNTKNDRQAPPPSFGGQSMPSRQQPRSRQRPGQRLQNANPAAPQNAGGRGPLGQTTKTPSGQRQVYNTYTRQTTQAQTTARSNKNKEKAGTVTGGFFNSGYDKYDTKRKRGQDFVSGYDRKYSGGVSQRRAADMQFSHVYDGHEPWDDCLPKEKDPWDKDFYSK